MKDVLKYLAWMAVAGVALVIVREFSRWVGTETQPEFTVSTPVDSGFAPIFQKEFRPRSTPFERASKPPAKLPKGVKESDVKRVIVVTKRLETDAERRIIDSTTVIELTTGEIFVPKVKGKEVSVEEYRYAPPILDFGLFGSVGASFGRSADKIAVLPNVGATWLQICGIVQLPLLTADLDGVGVGAGLRYRNYMIGALSHWRFDGANRQIKLSFQYCIN